MKNLKGLFFAVLAVTLSACGNVSSQPDQLSQSGTSNGQTSASAYQAADLRCSATPNILGTNSSISSEYRACTYGSTVGAIALFPSDSQSKGVCVFPVRVAANGQQSAIIADNTKPVTSRYVFQCVNAQSAGSVITYAGLNFNAIYVVDAAKSAQMSVCLASGDVANCAAYYSFNVSYGQFN